MEVFSLVGKIVLEGQEKLKSDLKALNEEAKETQKTFDDIKKVTTPLGIAMAAAGAAGLKMVDSSLKMNAQLAQTAITVGSTTDEMRELVLSTTNVTFGLQSVIDTLEILARAGVRGVDNLQASANAFDALADATGYTAEAVAEMLIPAFKNLGVAIPTTSTELDAFTYLVKNTMVNLEDFAAAMDYAAVYGGDLNLTIEEMVAIMAALEEKGITGSAVTRLFRTAVTQAATGAVTLSEALGLTQDEIDGFKGKLGDATGITDKYAAAANKQFGIMDKLKQMWAEFQLRIGTFLEPMQGMLIGMVALGGALVALPMIIPKVITAIRALSIAMRSLSLVGGALGLVGVIAAIGIGLYDLIRRGKDWTESVNNWTDALDSANDRLATLEEQGKGASEEAENLNMMIDDLTDALKRYSEVGDDNVVTQYNLSDAIDKLSDSMTRFHDWQKIAEGDLSNFEAKTFNDMFALVHLDATMADNADTVLDLLSGVEDQIKAMDDLSEAYTAAAGDAQILSMIESELNRRMQETAETTYDEAIESLQDYYGIAEEEEKSLLEMYEAEVSARQKSLNDQLRSVRDNTNDVISEYQREYNERVKLLDAETDATVKALQDQLDALDDAAKESSFEDEKTRIEQELAEAWTRKDKERLEKELADLLADHEREVLRDSLTDQIRDVQDAAEDKKREWQEELDANIANQEAILSNAEATINAELAMLENAVDIKKDLLRQEYEAAAAMQQDILDATLSRINQEVQAQINAWNTLASVASIPPMASSGTAGAGLGLGGSIRPYSTGGPILEPTLLYGLRSQKPYAIAGESGPEYVSPGGGGDINITGTFYIREEADISKVARELHRLRLRKGNMGS